MIGNFITLLFLVSMFICWLNKPTLSGTVVTLNKGIKSLQEKSQITKLFDLFEIREFLEIPLQSPDLKWGTPSPHHQTRTEIFFSLPISISQPFNTKGLNWILEESEESSDSNKVNFNPLGLTGAEISALKVEE